MGYPEDRRRVEDGKKMAKKKTGRLEEACEGCRAMRESSENGQEHGRGGENEKNIYIRNGEEKTRGMMDGSRNGRHEGKSMKEAEAFGG